MNNNTERDYNTIGFLRIKFLIAYVYYVFK